MPALRLLAYVALLIGLVALLLGSVNFAASQVERVGLCLSDQEGACPA